MTGSSPDSPRTAQIASDGGDATVGASHSAPIIGIIYNPRSHRNRGRDLDIAALPNVHVEQPNERSDIPAALARFANLGVNYLIINGGDGTVRDVLSCGQTVFAGDWPELAVLPKGKTNALNVDLGAPAGWTLADAVAAHATARRVKRRPVSIAPADGQTESIPGCGSSMLGFILGGGAFTLGVQAGQDAHRLGAFNSLAVGVTSAWGVLCGLLGSNDNIWRRGTVMQFLLGANRTPLPHCGEGDPARRSVFLASTLRRFPAGMKLFGAHEDGLKLLVLDRPTRRVLGMVPAIMAGWVPQWVKDRGLHQVAAEQFELTIEEEYILDGEAYPAGVFIVSSGPELSFVVP